MADRQNKIAAAVAAELGDERICDQCGATYDTYADDCSAPMDVRCPGFNRYDEVRMKYERAIK